MKVQAVSSVVAREKVGETCRHVYEVLDDESTFRQEKRGENVSIRNTHVHALDHCRIRHSSWEQLKNA